MFLQPFWLSAGIDSDDGSSDDEEFTERDANAAEANMSGDDEEDDDDDWAGSGSDDDVRRSAVSTFSCTAFCSGLPAQACHRVALCCGL